MGKRAIKQVPVGIEVTENEEGLLDIVILVDDEPDLDWLPSELPTKTTDYH